MIKVAYVLPFLRKPSGWRTHAVALLRAMRPLVDIDIYVSVADYPAARQLFPDEAIYILPVTQEAAFSNRANARLLLATAWKILHSKYPPADLVHSLEAYPTGLVGTWLARKLGCPHALTSHGTYGVTWVRQSIDRQVYTQVLRRTRLVCPVSQGTASLMQQYFGAALSGTRVIPILNGNEYYRQVAQEAALERAWPADPVLLTVAEVKPRKGLHTSLEAFARVKAECPRARYVIVGNYQPNLYFQRLHDIIARHHIQDVSFWGAVPDEALQRAYEQASLFVLTPEMDETLHFEGFGLVYLEAGAYGLPVVGTRTGGVPDAVRDGETGLLAEAGDSEGVAQAILRLINDRELMKKMGRANRFWAETLTWERYAQLQYLAYHEAGLA